MKLYNNTKIIVNSKLMILENFAYIPNIGFDEFDNLFYYFYIWETIDSPYSLGEAFITKKSIRPLMKIDNKRMEKRFKQKNHLNCELLCNYKNSYYGDVIYTETDFVNNLPYYDKSQESNIVCGGVVAKVNDVDAFNTKYKDLTSQLNDDVKPVTMFLNILRKTTIKPLDLMITSEDMDEINKNAFDLVSKVNLKECIY